MAPKGFAGFDVESNRNDGGATVSVKSDVLRVILRLLCVSTSLAAVGYMTTAKQNGAIPLYGVDFPISSNWSWSYTFEYVVGVSVTLAVYCLSQVLVGSSRLVKKVPVISSRSRAWLFFAIDQALAYLALSAASAAIGLASISRPGVKTLMPLPSICKSLQYFCDRVAISVAFTLFSCILMVASAVQDVIWLSNH